MSQQLVHQPNGGAIAPQHLTTQAAIMTLQDKMKYCEILSKANMLPATYAGNPGNVLVALELGDALGIQPIVTMMELYVVNNRPSMSAKLMNALIRRAGHKIVIESGPTEATVTIIRRDDPTPFRATFTWEQAERAGLTRKDTWKFYGPTMLVNRAISACARLAIPDLILGMGYTPEELGDDGKVEIVGELAGARAEQRPAEEPGTAKGYKTINVSDPQPVTKARTTRKKADQEPEAQQQQPPAEDIEEAEFVERTYTDATAAEIAANDPKASPEEINETWEAFKGFFQFDPHTGEKTPGLAKECLHKAFPGLSMANATISQVNAVNAYLAKTMDEAAQKARL